MLKMTQLSHYFISQYIKKEHLITADFTCGSGEDSAYFASFPNVDKVYSFDVQPAAIELARKQYPNPKIQYICDGHEHMDQYLQCFDIGIHLLAELLQVGYATIEIINRVPNLVMASREQAHDQYE